MPITITWDERQSTNTIRYMFTGLWDWYELEDIHADVLTTVSAHNHRISLIFDLIQSIDMPVGALSALQRMFAAAPKNLGPVMVVTTDATIGFTFNMVGNFDAAIGERIHVFETLTAAHQHLGSYYASR